MKLLLDQGLPRSAVVHLRNAGIEAIHVGDMGLSTASDAKILEIARREGQVVVTLDADFHTLLALSGATGPSVVRIRIEGLRADDFALLLAETLEACSEDLKKGAMISVTENGARVRQLPLLR
jgi:predicted nuclease of predicted toxin-antitoxin system